MNPLSKKLVTLIEIAIMAAIATVLDKLAIYQAPYGGSITLVMIPILVVGLRRGLWAGMTAGLLTGILQLLLGGYIVHPIQLLLDYPIAFGALGIAGLVHLKQGQNKNRQILLSGIGIFIAGLGRLLSHFVSGIVFFADSAPKGQSPYLYSFVYNAAYMVPNMILALIVAIILIYTAPQLVYRR
ncbi:energy-coupled thiamine transporter ThiT [Thermoflavimicrobium daqui]|jgi:thiamine transporter|uniref:Energy-coupled thiamine transporter ThiT n=1 Tax=Thermoflavimicrobium daqui TaxID=2137476 RepID=A0A364K746_9BACL|nr:energy-coupled thiamine transporter ThiT [Thermoflavimicrobium daqui]RAL26126.1 energy-coupled thiamine transporter ThiT [Thermoflavimicrobium daqui]